MYGITNIFLEHLGDRVNNAWSPKDLEHLSIAALFIGGGLFGMLIDSTGIRYFLNTTIDESIDASASTSAPAQAQAHTHAPEHAHPRSDVEVQLQLQPPRTYHFSLNPVPALIVLLVGKIMSSHTQADPLDSMIHKQWGDLLLASTIARWATYFLIYLKPPTSVFPSRPPTELLAAFALISGGVIFMESVSFLLSFCLPHLSLSEVKEDAKMTTC